jgi:hypothetical protein
LTSGSPSGVDYPTYRQPLVQRIPLMLIFGSTSADFPLGSA